VGLSETGRAVADRLELDEAESRDDVIVVGRKGQVALLLFDRPEVLNAYNRAMIREIGRLWPELDADPSVRSIVVGSTTDKVFHVGIDLKEVADIGYREPDADEGEEETARDAGLTSRDAGVWKPVVSAVEGRAMGGGLHWVVEADIVVASETAFFQDSHVNVGMVGNRENLGFAVKAGMGAALYLTLVGRAARIDAPMALQLGLVQEVVPAGAALRRALELATIIAGNSPSAMAKSMQAMWALTTTSYEEAVQYGWRLLREQQDHPDAMEGPTAFAEKRPPRWADLGR
jgi:enoyl-CoA hydratase/carnithine racemase